MDRMRRQDGQDEDFEIKDLRFQILKNLNPEYPARLSSCPSCESVAKE
jgi:hypothetical protein